MDEIYFYYRKEKYGWFSNFERTGFWAPFDEGMVEKDHKPTLYWFPTNEHYYQAMRSSDFKIREYIRSAPHAWYAMKLGQNLKVDHIHPDWDGIKLDVMLRGLRYKFGDEKLKLKLLATGDAIIHENSQTDYFWGCGADKTGKSWLGKLLMQVRDDIRRN